MSSKKYISSVVKRTARRRSARLQSSGVTQTVIEATDSILESRLQAVEKLLDWFELDEDSLIKAKYGLYSLGAITAKGKSSSAGNGTGGSGSSTLAGLSDVRITSPADSQILAYDSTTGRWVNKTISLGGGEAYTLPLASWNERGGIKIGFNESWSVGNYYDIPLELSNEAAFIRLTPSIFQKLLGYTPLDSKEFTAESLGLADWALAANKPSYAWNEIDQRPTYLSDFTNDLDLGSLAYKDSLTVSDIPPLPWSKITDGKPEKLTDLANNLIYAWALAANKPSYTWNEINSKPTTLAGYGLTDAVIYQSEIDPSSAYKNIGYGYAATGWKTSGPAMIFGTSLYSLAMQCAIANADYVSLYLRMKYNGVDKGWDRVVTEGLMSAGVISFDASAYKCRGDVVLHRNAEDAVTFLNFGPANSDGASLNAFGHSITFYAGKATDYDTYLTLDGDLGNVQVRKPLHLSQALYTKTIYAEGPVILRMTSGDRFFRSRSIDAAGTTIAEIGFGVSDNNKIRGIYDYTDSRWLLVNYGDGRVVYQGDKFLVKTTAIYEPKDGYTTPIRLGGSVRIDGSLYLPNSGQVKIANSAGDKDLIIFQLNNNNDFLVGQKTAAEGYDTYLYGNALHFKINKGITEALTITTNGRVGIGKTDPACALDVGLDLNSRNFMRGAGITSDPTSAFQSTIFGEDALLDGTYRMRLVRTLTGFGRVTSPYAATLCLKSGDTHGYISIPYTASVKNKCYIGGGIDNDINWDGVLFHDNMDLIPKDDGVFYLGYSDKRWRTLNVVNVSADGIYGYVPEGGTYQRYRLISSDDRMYLQVGAQDGTATTGKLTISGISVATLIDLTIYSQQTLFSGAVQVNGTSQFVSLATFDKGIKIGDATLTWDATAEMLKFDKGLYSVGAITAGKKSSGSQPSGSQSSASAEWYNIKTKRLTNEDTIATDIYNIIENFDERLLDTDNYRIVLMTFKRKKGQGFGWRIPMFSPRYNADSGEILNEATPCAIAWNNTWWPALSSETLVLNQTGANITEVINIGASTDRFARSNSKKIRIGFAIFKKTLDSDGNPVGTWGWQRVSNIAEIMLYYAEVKQITMVRVIE